MQNLINILSNIIKNRSFKIIFKKFLKRFEKNNSSKALRWAQENHYITTEEFCSNIDKKLFDLVTQETREIEKKSLIKINNLNLDLGGGGNFILLNFLVRKLKPNIVVETGVGAGWSSLFILDGLKKNNYGKLYSSDFPYFRYKNPDKFVGYLVDDDELKKYWQLSIEGDSIALPKILSSIKDQCIDLFHYDSDKSYSGRSYAIDLLQKKFTQNTVIIIDDIQDNLHFRDFVKENSLEFTVLEFQQKYVGIIGI